jgi:AraC-like DNA-binding protein/tetratricopeptide (TPR) repeat protein
VSVLPRSVRRALDLMQSALERDIGITELATAAGVSGRALQRQFKAFLGKSPREALTDMRFESARRQLLQGAPGLKIMEVALRCGFPHFGRFSIDYRRRYGETPSHTLKRQALFSSMVSTRFPLSALTFVRPVVAVGPIEAGPPHHDAARCIADELSAALIRGGIAVSSRPESARFHLAGTIKEAGAQTRLIFRLIDRESGRHLWAHRADGPFGDAGGFDDLLASRITAALRPSLRASEIDAAVRKHDCDLGAQDLALRALPGVLSLDPESNARALEVLNSAMERDPKNALAVALAAWAHGQRVVYQFASDAVRERAHCAALARKALALGAGPSALAIIASALSIITDETAEQVVAKALAADGGSAWAWGRSGWIEVYKGNAESAIERLTIALELAPDDPLAFNNMAGIGMAHFGAGRYREAAYWQQRALIEHPQSAWIDRHLCPAYLLAGAREEAGRSLLALRNAYPDLTVAGILRAPLPLPQADRNRLVEALADAGLPS